MKTIVRWLAILVALACVPVRVAAAPAGSSRGVKASSAAKKASTHGKKKWRAKRAPMQKAPTADRITEIQSALARAGYYQGAPNGNWDADTIGAMQKFQSSNGLEATGKLDALSLQKLGLGSSIAGVSAPKLLKPPAGSASPAPSAAPSGAAMTGSILNGVSASNATPSQ
jgi:peptidoglycan hydrolase-like protein with peptidoglycan-binding domain